MLLDIRLLSDCLTDGGFYDFFLSLFTFLCSKLTENSDGRKNKRVHTCVKKTKNFFDNSDQPAKGESLFWVSGLAFLHIACRLSVGLLILCNRPCSQNNYRILYSNG